MDGVSERVFKTNKFVIFKLKNICFMFFVIDSNVTGDEDDTDNDPEYVAAEMIDCK